METRIIFFVGKPGCGKGDQTKLLSEKTGWPVYSSGDLFRAIAEDDSPVGKKVQEENYAGILQPHWFATYLFLKTLFSIASDTGAIFDGFCRKVPETQLVIDSLGWLDRPFSVVHLQVSDEEIIRRLALRKGIEGRADDNVVEKRLKEYLEYTVPAIELFRSKEVLIEIDGERAREPIAEDIRAVLKI